MPLNGVVTDTGDKSYPLCYTQGTTASVAVLLAPVPAIPSGSTLITSGQVKIKGTSANSISPGQPNFNLPATAATVDTTGVSISATPLANAFPTTVAYISNIAIQWNYSNDGGTTYQTGGVSNHKVYLTLGDPLTTNLYQTVLDVGCRNATGKSKASDVVDAIWSDFHNSLSTGVKDANGKPMKYWPDGYATPGLFYTKDLITQKKGRCGSWAEFFRDILRAQAIGADIYGIELRSEIKPVASVAPPGYPQYLSSNSDGSPGDGFYTDPKHPAQGNSGPSVTYGQGGAGLPVQWYDHAVVSLTPGTKGAIAVDGPASTSIYDPSYGYVALKSTFPDAQVQWEADSIPGYWSLYTNGSGAIQYSYATPAAVRSNLQQRNQSGASLNPNPPYETFTYDKHTQQ